MNNRPESEKKLIAALGKQDSTQQKMGRIKEVYEIIKEMESVGYTQERIVEILKDGGLPLNMTTFKTYLYRLRKKATNKEPVREIDTLSNDGDGKAVGGNPPPAVEYEEVEGLKANSQSLDDILNARQRDSDGATDRYLMATKPLRRKGK